MTDPYSHRCHQRFWCYVAKSRGCWEWLGSRDPDGYGRFSAMWRGTRKAKRAHRFAWEVCVGALASTDILRHSCDNPACVNPEHMSKGAHADNVRDKCAKGRASCAGPGDNKPKLSYMAAECIRERHESGESTYSLAREYGVSRSSISAVVNGLSYARHNAAPRGAAVGGARAE